jgi:hypothetical protein
MLPEIYPKPVAFYQHPNFEGDRCEILAPDTDLSRIHLYDADEDFASRILSQLKLSKFRHVGRLRGEYLLQHRCLLALDRHGTPIKLNTDALDDWAMSSLFCELEIYCAQTAFPLYRKQLLRGWGDTAVAKDLVVLGGTHADHNYYHFSICMLPHIRHFADVPGTCVGLPSQCLERRFQFDLLHLTFGHRTILPLPDGVRVVDPMLIYEPVTVQGIQWLRKRTGLRAHRGNRLIYVERRSSQTGRVGGCIEETDSFQEFIRKNGFERVDFGVGDTPLVDQVAMLDGARVILSAHGANLTNITYVAEGVSVIEVMPYYWTYFSHMQIASAVGLNYFGIVSHLVNEDQNCTLRMDVLEQAFQAALDAAPPVAMAHGKIFPAMVGVTC